MRTGTQCFPTTCKSMFPKKKGTNIKKNRYQRKRYQILLRLGIHKNHATHAIQTHTRHSRRRSRAICMYAWISRQQHQSHDTCRRTCHVDELVVQVRGDERCVEIHEELFESGGDCVDRDVPRPDVDIAICGRQSHNIAHHNHAVRFDRSPGEL